MVRFSSYMILLFCLSAMLWLMGYSSIADQMKTHGTNPMDLTTILDPNTGILALVIGSIAFATLLFLSGFSAIYVIPAAFLYYLLGYFIFPMSAAMTDINSLPYNLNFIVIGFYNLLLILATLSFIRGEA